MCIESASLSLPPVTEVLVHRGSMLLLDHLLSVEGDICVAQYTPRRDAWYADANGDMPAWIGVELMAQCIAAWIGVQQWRQEGRPNQGVLLGTRRYQSAQPSFAAEQPLYVTARASFRDTSGFGAFDCSLASAQAPERLLASALLKVFEPDDFNQIMRTPSSTEPSNPAGPVTHGGAA